MTHNLDELMQEYGSKKEAIAKRLADFKDVWSNGSDEQLFAELCFCILTPQSKARICDAVIRQLVQTRMLFDGTAPQMEKKMKGVRFAKNKARYIIEARSKFSNYGKFKTKKILEPMVTNPTEARTWIFRNVKGLGMKEASHFMRNIGFGAGLAILDRHILKNLKKHGIIEEIPKSLTTKRYLEIEKEMKRFADELHIGLDELDLLFWSHETGEIFK